MDNKNSYFSLKLPISPSVNNEVYLDDLDDSIDLISSSMAVNNNLYKFSKGDEISCYFKSERRKRKGQLNKYCANFLPDDQEFKAVGMTKAAFDMKISVMRKKKYIKIIEEPLFFSDYSGKDLKKFDNPNNWLPWQTEVYNMFFNKDGTYTEPDDRTIISLVDEPGKSGKSQFYKWLFINHPTTIAKLGYATASQLRCATVKMGKKNLYIIDLTRSKGKEDKQEDLLSIIEDCKNGCVQNFMRGSGESLICPPPHVLVSSNYILDYELLSADRWRAYRITQPSMKLKKISTVKKKSKRQPVKK